VLPKPKETQMKSSKGTFSMIAVLGIAAMATAVLLAAAESGQSAPHSSKDCRIISTEDGGMLQLTATFTAPVAMTGDYQFSVVGSGSSGSTQISQGKAFQADPGETLTLGRVSLSRDKVYDVKLKIQSATGEGWRCNGKFDV
jgi:hypothetical protein